MELKLGYATPEAVRELFAEYTHMLVAHDPYFQAYLDLQHYDAEVADPTQSTACRTDGSTSRGAMGSRPGASRCAGSPARRAGSSGWLWAPRFPTGASPGR